MDLNSINENVTRLITNGSNLITFLKEFAVDGAKDVSINYVNTDGTTSTKTFPNITKQIASLETWKGNFSLFDTKNENEFTVTRDYVNGERFELYDGNTHPHTSLVRIYFTSAGKGGSVYDGRISFLLSSLATSNGNSSSVIPSSFSGHSIHGRTVEISTLETSSAPQKLMLKINGESASEVDFKIKIKRIW